jgi:hypothetical protein
MLEAYLDESGIHEQAKVCAVAGFYGSQMAWRRFERQWKAVISKYPEIDEGFHAKVFFARDKGKRVGPYQEWKDEKAKRFLDSLLKCIRGNRIYPVGHAVVVDAFLALPLKIRQWLTGAKFRPKDAEYLSGGCPRKAYYLPFQFCVSGSANLGGASPSNLIHFFAGLDRNFSGYASELYKFFRTDERIPEPLRRRLGQISYPLSKETPGIQAADLLAYRTYRHCHDLLINRNTPTPDLLRSICKRAKPKQRSLLLDQIGLMELQRIAVEQYNSLKEAGKLEQ